MRESKLAVFDTEATSIVKDSPYAVLYYWDFLIPTVDITEIDKDNVSDVCVHINGRDCSSLYSQITKMVEDAIDKGYKWVVGVHNLSYDICFIRKYINNLQELGYSYNVSARSTTKFLKLDVIFEKDVVFTFFDTLALFGCSLRTLGDNLGFEKLYIDYNESISPDTTLSKENTDYNNRDTEILMVAVCKSLLTRPHVTLEDLGTSILTRTSIVRKGDREESRIGKLPVKARKSRSKKSNDSKVKSSPTTIYDCDRREVKKHQYDSLDEYMNWASYGDTVSTDVKGFFAGGVNISNTNLIGTICTNVISYDLKSAYPAIMLSYKVPTDPDYINDSELQYYTNLLDRHIPNPMDIITCKYRFWYGTIVFYDVEIDKYWQSHVGDVSISQTMILQNYKKSENVVFEDGYMTNAEKLVLTLSISEFYEFCIQYTWKDATFEKLCVYKNSSYPTDYQILRVLFHYQEKTVAKTVSKMFAKGVRPEEKTVDEWLGHSYITYDEASAIKSWNIDSDWMESFVLAHKGNLNSLYGIQVTSPLKDEYTLDSNGFLDVVEGDKFERYENTSRNSLMWRESGVCISTFNRYKIVYMAKLAIDAGATVIYVDTDSIKSVGLTKDVLDSVFEPLHNDIEFYTNKLVMTAIEGINNDIIQYNEDTDSDILPVDVPNDKSFRDLGKLDYEETYPKFVTMGHKKYAVVERGEWVFKCSGYKLKVLNEFGRHLMSVGLDDLTPMVVLGYNNRYDSSTEIASIQSTIPDIWVRTEFDAVIESGKDTQERYEGNTCPGYAILPAGKIMNNTEHSVMNAQRFTKACMNNPYIKDCSYIDIRKDGVFSFGKRHCIKMDWKKWDLDWNEGIDYA
jgi:hypothetical protein